MLELLEVTPAVGQVFSESLRFDFHYDGRWWEYLCDYHCESAPGVITASLTVVRLS